MRTQPKADRGAPRGRVLVAAACGDDDDDDDDAATTEAPGTDAEGTEAAGTEATGHRGTDGRRAPTAPKRPAGTGGAGDESGRRAGRSSSSTSDPNQPIGVTIPLTGVPEPKTFAWLECELESCPYITVGIEAATEALGWELIRSARRAPTPARPSSRRSTPASTTSPAPGEARSLYEEQAQAAADAGIKILSCFDTEPPAVRRPTSTRSAATPRSSRRPVR